MSDTSMNVLKVLLLGFMLMVGVIMLVQNNHLEEKVIASQVSLEKLEDQVSAGERDRQQLQQILSRLEQASRETERAATEARQEVASVTRTAEARERQLVLLEAMTRELTQIRMGLDRGVRMPVLVTGEPSGDAPATPPEAQGTTPPEPAGDTPTEPTTPPAAEESSAGTPEDLAPAVPPRPASGPGVERYTTYRVRGVGTDGGRAHRWGIPADATYGTGRDLTTDTGQNVLAAILDDHDPALDGGTLRRYFTSDFKGFNYMTESAAMLSDLESHVHTTLASRRRTDPDVWEERLAHACEIHDDYRTYVFRLRRGVLWSPLAVDLESPRYAWLAGEHEVTAHDFKFTLDLILDPEVRAGHLQNYYGGDLGVEEVYCPDDYTLVVRWRAKVYHSKSFTMGLAPTPRFLYLFDENGNELGPEVVGASYNDHWYDKIAAVGCGAYTMVSHQPGELVRLVRNEDYCLRRGNPDVIEFQIIKDSNLPLVRLKAGELDEIAMLPNSYKEEFLETAGEADSPFHNGTFKVEFLTALGYYYLGWNADRPLFADARVRRAMTLCMPRQRIVDDIWLGMAEVVTGPFFFRSPANDESIEPWLFDPEAAAALLQEAGWADADGDGILEHATLEGDDGEPLEFRFKLLLFNNSAEYANLANLFREELRQIGVQMDPLPVDWPLMQQKMEERDFDCYTGGWALGWEPDPYQLWHSSQADLPKSSNRIGFRNQEADEIIETLRVTFDEEKRLELLHRFHRIVHEEQPYTFLFARFSPRARERRVARVVYSLIRPQTLCTDWALDPAMH